jgi:signal transduction histidine kinase/DNA-binding response OmpR family regulator/ligand-binding sensor domain-containing protein
MYNYEQITVKDGLLSNRVNIIHRDQLGYIWIGTNLGLHKYDGENMRRYIHGYDKDMELGFGFIKFIFEDSLSQLWVGTDAGLMQYDRFKDRLVLVDIPDLQNRLYSYVKVPGGIIFGSERELILYDYESQNLRKVPLPDLMVQNNHIYQLANYDDSNIVLANLNGLWRYNLSSNQFDLIADFDFGSTPSLLVDGKGIIWVASAQDGIRRFDFEGEKQALKIQNVINPHSHFVQDLVAKDNQIWISTDGKGIFIYDSKTEKIQNLVHQQGSKNSLAANSILDLYVDKFGNVLSGSVRAGLISVNEVNIKSFTENLPGYKYGLSHPTVLALYEDNNEKIWLGTDGGGLNAFDPLQDTFEHINQYKTQKVVSICEYDSNKVLVSFYRGSIQLFNINTHRFESIDKNPWLKNLSDTETGIPVIIKKDQQGNIWKFGQQLKILRPNGTIERIDSVNGWRGDLESNFSSLININDSELFLAGRGGLYRINKKDKSIKRLLSLHDAKWRGVRSFRYAYSMIQRKDQLWIATSMGLYSHNIKTGENKQHKNDVFRNAYGIVPADENSFWISTGTGLYRYYPDENIYLAHGRSEGVRHYEFVNRAILKAKNGDVYVGAVDGLVKIKASEKIESSDEEVVVSIDHLLSDGVPVGGGNGSSFENNVLKLPWDNSSLRINLIVNEKNFLRKRLFRYNIEGYSDEVIETANSQLTLSHLPAGNYTLKIFSNKADGSWSDKSAELKILVPRPWWKQWWFFSLVILVIAIFFILIKHFLTKQSELTVELELERDRKEQVRLLNEKKLEFFTNISHELRTPLSLIYGPLKRLVDGKYWAGDKNWPQIVLMYRQADKMKTLVDQVLDIRKIDAGMEELKNSEVNIEEWLNSFFKQYEFELESKSLELEMACSYSDHIACDLDKLDKVLSNLLGNAIKYSPHGGSIFFKLFTQDNKLYFSVGDEGKGVKEGEKLFERFYQGKDHKSGSGVGLAFTKSLINLMEGQISVKNRPEGGAQFEFYLPVNTSEIRDKENFKITKNVKRDSSDHNELDYTILEDKTIMVVEDDADLQQFIVNGLKEYCQVIGASNGKEAWHLILSKQPDLVVSDVMMPVMDGFELCAKIKSDVRVSHMPVLLLTARSDGESRLLGYKSGADAYLSKPFNLDVLSVRLHNIFTSREVQRELFKNGVDNLPKSVTYSNADELFLKKVIAIIEKQMDDPAFDVNRLNSELAMSRSSFYAKIKAITGQGVNDFIKSQKINKAASLLKETTLPVYEIADAVGYENQRYFSTVFKELKGCTPTQFRQVSK